MKKYCLLENGDIENCYYDEEQKKPRRIYKEGGHYYLDHDKYGNGCIIMFHHRIVKFGDTIKELKRSDYAQKK